MNFQPFPAKYMAQDRSFLLVSACCFWTSATDDDHIRLCTESCEFLPSSERLPTPTSSAAPLASADVALDPTPVEQAPGTAPAFTGPTFSVPPDAQCFN